jgi:hypothetical protein
MLLLFINIYFSTLEKLNISADIKVSKKRVQKKVVTTGNIIFISFNLNLIVQI